MPTLRCFDVHLMSRSRSCYSRPLPLSHHPHLPLLCAVRGPAAQPHGRPCRVPRTHGPQPAGGPGSQRGGAGVAAGPAPAAGAGAGGAQLWQAGVPGPELRGGVVVRKMGGSRGAGAGDGPPFRVAAQHLDWPRLGLLPRSLGCVAAWHDGCGSALPRPLLTLPRCVCRCRCG